MITSQHVQSLKNYVAAQDASAIHVFLKNLSVADQKRGKSVLVGLLADECACPVQQALSLYVQLLLLDLNFYFQSFTCWCEAHRCDEVLWSQLAVFRPLGERLRESRVFYRQKLLQILLQQVEAGRDLTQLFEVFCVSAPTAQVKYLLETDSIYGLYRMFQLMQQQEIDRKYITQCCYYLVKSNADCVLKQDIREDIANFISHYFNGIALNYTFRRTIEVQWFSYAESSYESFCKILG